MAKLIPVTLEKVSNLCTYNSRPAFCTYFADYGKREDLEEIYFKIRGKSNLNLKDFPELKIFTEPGSQKEQKKTITKEVKKINITSPLDDIEDSEEDGIHITDTLEIPVGETEEPKKVKVLKTEVKPIAVNESRQLRSPEQIADDPELKTKISKVIALHKGGYSPEFISEFGQKKGFLKKFDSAKEVTWQLKSKGYIQSDKE